MDVQKAISEFREPPQKAGWQQEGLRPLAAGSPAALPPGKVPAHQADALLTAEFGKAGENTMLYNRPFFVYNEEETRSASSTIHIISGNNAERKSKLRQFLQTYLTNFGEANMIFSFYTLGCKVNQYETQAMEHLLQAQGHEIRPFDEPCDAYIINTCSVTAVSDKKNRAVIRRCRREHPDAIIGVCGCYSQHDPKAIEALGADIVSGSGDRQAFLDMMLAAVSDRQKKTQVDNALRRRVFEVLPAGGLSQRTRAMVKVQDGCVNFCSYCIIPYTRGPVRSAPLELVVEQVKELAREGFREIVVTGIEIASWGVDLPGKPSMVTLIATICQAAPELRIRLGSLEPRVITPEFCQELARFANLCPQFHLSMQSGCDSVLQRMKRKYDTARYLESVRLLQEAFPGCAITTDMIVAFPGETEEEFGASLDFIRECDFADMHIFPYSRRPGTPADKMPGQHSNAVKEERSRRAIAVVDEMSARYRDHLIGTTQAVLFEEISGGFYTGHAPNYVRVYAKGENLHNQIKPVAITERYQDGVLGVIVPEEM